MIHVLGLSKRYGDKLALDNISFDVHAGEVLGLLGLNGAGKSTTMNILTGYIGATEGIVTIDGHDVAREPRQAKRVIGYLPEQLALYGDMRVSEYLGFCCDLKGLRGARREHLAGICERVGIASVTGRMIRNLSRGFRQRLGFAQALIGDPKVLILDEPTTGLDPSQIIEIRTLVREIGKTRTVVISSHVLSEIQAVCTRVAVLYNGRLLADAAPANLGGATRGAHRIVARILGTPDQVCSALGQVPEIKAVTVLEQREPGAFEYAVEGDDQQDIRVGLFRALARADLPLLSTSSDASSLEDVFLRLVREQAEGAGGPR